MEEKTIVSSRVNIAIFVLPFAFIGAILGFIVSAMICNHRHWSLFELEESIEMHIKCMTFGAIIVSAIVACKPSQLVVTDKRIYGRTTLGRRVDLPLDAVSAVGTGWLGSVAVGTSSGRIFFAGIKNRDEIYNAINQLLFERQEKKSETAATVVIPEAPQNNIEELKKYKELLDMEVITQEEYDAKKKQLLGL